MSFKEKDIAVAAVAEGCRIARRAQADIAASGERVLKGDRSPVTIADLAVQAVITSRLMEAGATISLMAEEDTTPFAAPNGDDVERRAWLLAKGAAPELDQATLRDMLRLGSWAGGEKGRGWVLDPFDGTKGFLRGDQYAIALALLEHGRVRLGIVGCPNLPQRPGDPMSPVGCLFVAERGAGAVQLPVDGGGAVSIRVDDIVDPAAGSFCESVESAHSSHGATAWVAARLGITAPPYRVDGQTKYAIVARGEASVYLRLPTRIGYREKVWDHAAGSLLVEEAGGLVSHVNGDPLDFRAGRTLPNPTGIVVTNAALHDSVLAAIRQEPSGAVG